MGFSLSNMDWKLRITLENTLDLGGSLLRKFFSKEETGIKEQILKEFRFVG